MTWIHPLTSAHYPHTTGQAIVEPTIMSPITKGGPITMVSPTITVGSIIMLDLKITKISTPILLPTVTRPTIMAGLTLVWVPPMALSILNILMVRTTLMMSTTMVVGRIMAVGPTTTGEPTSSMLITYNTAAPTIMLSPSTGVGPTSITTLVDTTIMLGPTILVKINFTLVSPTTLEKIYPSIPLFTTVSLPIILMVRLPTIPTVGPTNTVRATTLSPVYVNPTMNPTTTAGPTILTTTTTEDILITERAPLTIPLRSPTTVVCVIMVVATAGSTPVTTTVESTCRAYREPQSHASPAAWWAPPSLLRQPTHLTQRTPEAGDTA